MKKLSRRQFIVTSSKLIGATALGSVWTACGAEPEAAVQTVQTASVPWRYAICNEIMQDWDWERQCTYAREVGYTGLEVAPFTLADHVDDISAERRAELKSIADGAGVEVIGLHWLLVTPTGLHAATTDPDLRRQTWDYVAKLATLCADLGGTVMIFGSPGQRSTWMPDADGERIPLGITAAQARANFAEGCREVADRIGDAGVQLLIEPLSSDQTDVIITLAEAQEVVDAVNHPAVSAMFDFHNTADETAPLDELVRNFHPEYIKHIQIQEMDGTYMGTGTGQTDFLPAIQAFKDEGYDGWVSLEVFDFEPGPEKIATESFAVLKAMEAELE